MTWLEIDDGILDHPKFIRAVKLGGSEAVHLWLGLKAYCNQQLTDGFVPTDMLDEVRGPKDPKKRAAALQVLRDVGLLDEATGGLALHNYLKLSRSRAAVLESRRKNAERQAKSRVSNTTTNAGSNAVTDGVTTSRVTSSVTTPSPLPLLAIPDLNTPPPSVGPPHGADITKSDLDSFAPDPAVISGQRKPREKKPKPVKWCRFPSDFEPDDSHRRIAAQLGLDLAQQLAEIRDHEFTKPKSDPAAALRNWLRRSKQFGNGGGVLPPRSRPVIASDDERVRMRNHLFDVAKAGRAGPQAKAWAESGENIPGLLDKMEDWERKRRDKQVAQATAPLLEGIGRHVG